AGLAGGEAQSRLREVLGGQGAVRRDVGVLFIELFVERRRSGFRLARLVDLPRAAEDPPEFAVRLRQVFPIAGDFRMRVGELLQDSYGLAVKGGGPGERGRFAGTAATLERGQEAIGVRQVTMESLQVGILAGKGLPQVP